MMNIGQSILLIIVVAVVTFFTRAIPFLIWGGKREVPPLIKYLGKVLPPAIMVILVVYCLKNVNLLQGNHGAPEFIASGMVIILHLWKRNTLLSVGVGTVTYMILIQTIFC